MIEFNRYRMKNKIKELLYKFWCANCWGSDRTMEETLNHYTEKFFKLINMDTKYCRPQEPPEKIYGYTLFELKKIINFAKSKEYNPKEKKNG